VIAGIYDGPAEGLFDAFVTETAIAQMAHYAEEARPFFLACQWFGPHLPYFLPQSDYHRYAAADIPLPASMADTLADKPRVQAHYAAHWSFDSFSPTQWRELIAADWGYVSLLDREVGKIMEALDRLGLAQNTVVIFTTDHGAFNGAHRMQDKGPAMYDDTYRVPLIVRMPPTLAGEETSEMTRDGAQEEARMVTLVDLTPTFLDWAGVPIPADYDGRSLLPLLRNKEVAWRDHIVAEFHGHHFPYPQRMIRTPRYKLVINPPDIDELYDLECDPHEMVNQINNPAYTRVRRDLATTLYHDLRAAGDNFYHWMTSMEPVDTGEVDASLSQYEV
jgi:arylsulfatase A-like enzyme